MQATQTAGVRLHTRERLQKGREPSGERQQQQESGGKTLHAIR
jgi:hypothetical protein